MMVVRFDGQEVVVSNVADAVSTWEKYRDENGLGASDCAWPSVWMDGECVAVISYNGTVSR